jgi:hypothetical protein
MISEGSVIEKSGHLRNREFFLLQKAGFFENSPDWMTKSDDVRIEKTDLTMCLPSNGKND